MSSEKADDFIALYVSDILVCVLQIVHQILLLCRPERASWIVEHAHSAEAGVGPPEA